MDAGPFFGQDLAENGWPSAAADGFPFGGLFHEGAARRLACGPEARPPGEEAFMHVAGPAPGRLSDNASDDRLSRSAALQGCGRILGSWMGRRAFPVTSWGYAGPSRGAQAPRLRRDPKATGPL